MGVRENDENNCAYELKTSGADAATATATPTPEV